MSGGDRVCECVYLSRRPPPPLTAISSFCLYPPPPPPSPALKTHLIGHRVYTYSTAPRYTYILLTRPILSHRYDDDDDDAHFVCSTCDHDISCLPVVFSSLNYYIILCSERVCAWVRCHDGVEDTAI